MGERSRAVTWFREKAAGRNRVNSASSIVTGKSRKPGLWSDKPCWTIWRASEGNALVACISLPIEFRGRYQASLASMANVKASRHRMNAIHLRPLVRVVKYPDMPVDYQRGNCAAQPSQTSPLPRPQYLLTIENAKGLKMDPTRSDKLKCPSSNRYPKQYSLNHRPDANFPKGFH